MQAPQFRDAFTSAGHSPQLEPYQRFWHVQLHPLLLLPDTLDARLEQLLLLVHVRKHEGYVSKAGRHLEQSPARDPSNGNGHEAQLGVVQFPRHTQVQFGKFPETFRAWLEQSNDDVHTRGHPAV
jgi:hypothetical protein